MNIPRYGTQAEENEPAMRNEREAGEKAGEEKARGAAVKRMLAVKEFPDGADRVILRAPA